MGEKVTILASAGREINVVSGDVFDDNARAWSVGLSVGRSLPLDALPDLFNGEAVAELSVVIPLVPLYLALERLSFPFDYVEILRQPILWSFLIHFALQSVGPACGAC